MIILTIVSLAIGVGLGWALCRLHGRHERLMTNARIIHAWIHARRDDMPDLGPYRSTQPESVE